MLGFSPGTAGCQDIAHVPGHLVPQVAAAGSCSSCVLLWWVLSRSSGFAGSIQACILPAWLVTPAPGLPHAALLSQVSPRALELSGPELQAGGRTLT